MFEGDSSNRTKVTHKTPPTGTPRTSVRTHLEIVQIVQYVVIQVQPRQSREIYLRRGHRRMPVVPCPRVPNAAPPPCSRRRLSRRLITRHRLFTPATITVGTYARVWRAFIRDG